MIKMIAPGFQQQPFFISYTQIFKIIYTMELNMS